MLAGAVPKLQFQVYLVSANSVTSLHYMYMVSTSPSMLCYEPKQARHEIGYRFKYYERP